MTVAVVAKYPWGSVASMAGDETPRVYVLTDSRVSETEPWGKPRALSEFQIPKQIALAQNLVVCFASSHLFPTKEALHRKLLDPTTRGGQSIATVRDVRRLGELLVEQHKALGGYSQMIAAVWPKTGDAPKVFQLMPPHYVPSEVYGIVGVGEPDVLSRFKALLPEQLERQRLAPDNPAFNREVLAALRRSFGAWPKPVVWQEAMFAVHVALVDALIDSPSETAAIPVTLTVLDRHGLNESYASSVLLTTDELIHVSRLFKPAHYGRGNKIPPYQGPRLQARQLF